MAWVVWAGCRVSRMMSGAGMITSELLFLLMPCVVVVVVCMCWLYASVFFALRKKGAREIERQRARDIPISFLVFRRTRGREHGRGVFLYLRCINVFTKLFTITTRPLVQS